MKKLVVGSRDSKLAVAQTKLVMERIQKENPNVKLELLTLKTTGDLILDKTLDKIGGKGLFVKELDKALQEGVIDLAVHSLKDMPAEENEDFPILAVLKRGDARDALVFANKTGGDITKRVGTSSLRRRLQFSQLCPEAQYTFTRGNIHTRLRKLDSGECDCLILAAAGLKRMGLAGRIGRYLSTEEMIPAAGQGILAIQGRKDWMLPKALNHPNTMLMALAERAFVNALGGGCSAPVGAFAQIEGQDMLLCGFYENETTKECKTMQLLGEKHEAQKLGETLAERIMA